MNLTPYIARGFPGNLDKLIAEVPVGGIDRQQTQGMIRLCPETEAALYSSYSPTRVRYKRGSRPRLEAIVKSFDAPTPLGRVKQAIAWTNEHVKHPHLVRNLVPDRAMTEEQLIDSGIGWCNEQSRVFIGLCEAMEIPARVCFLFHSNLRCGHTATEVFLENRWAFVDVTFDIVVRKPNGELAEGRELAGPLKQLAHDAYRPSLAAYFKKTQPYVETCPGWRSADRPTLEEGGELLGILGICNYVIDGAESVTG